uniref:porin n=1 Tax=Paraburkholderia tropica TaxID=92647 RepID=UPI002AB7511C
MKKTTYALVAGLAVAAQGAFAQSSVTLYGIADVGVRFATHQASASGPENRVYMSDGATTGSRWGLRGTEDLGAGTSAIFTLESGYSLTNGVSGQQGQLFSRTALVGLSNKTYGTVKFGRMFGTAFDFLINFDPVAGGDLAADDWEDLLVGLRYDNTVQYSNSFGPLSVELQRSFGNQAGSVAVGSTTAALATWNGGPFTVGLLGQQSKDAKSRDLNVGAVGGKYTFGKATIDSYFIYTHRDAGFTISANNSGLPLANTSITSNANTAAGTGTQTSARTDRVFLLGGTYLATPSLALTLAGLYDWTANVAPGKSGRTGSVYAIADYLLSKRSDVYVEADYAHLSGASVTDPNSPIGTFAGKNSSVGAMVGLRTRF